MMDQQDDLSAIDSPWGFRCLEKPCCSVSAAEALTVEVLADFQRRWLLPDPKIENVNKHAAYLIGT